MINAELIIRDEANKISRRFRDGRGSEDDFVDRVDRCLLDYDDPTEQLIFLYQMHGNLSEFYEKHLITCNHRDDPDPMKCGNNRFFLKSIYFIEREIRKLNPEFDFKIVRPQINADLIKKNLVELNKYPKAGKLYLQALDKLNEGKNDRNLLDDLRLTIEVLLKEILGTNKSLENQFEFLGKYLKGKGTSAEITNMFRTIINTYSKYQNNYVKHSDSVKVDEIDFLVNISSAMISFLLQKK